MYLEEHLCKWDLDIIVSITSPKARRIYKWILLNIDNNNLFSLTASDIAKELNVNPVTIRRTLKKLRDSGIIEKIGYSRYKLIKKPTEY